MTGFRRYLPALVCLLGCSLLHARDAGAQAPGCSQPVLTVAEAAALLRVDAADLVRLAEDGTVPGRRVDSTWRFNCEALLAWLTNDPLSISGTGTGRSQGGAKPEGASQQARVGEAPEERLAEDIFLRSQRVLLGPGDVVVDFGQFYARRDDQVLAAVGDGVGLAVAEQEVLTTLVQARVGIFNETELFAGGTFNRHESRVTFGGVNLTGDTQADLGGATLGVRRTIVREGRGRPSIIATISGYVPTDDRPYLLGGGLVLVKSIDPAALFFNANYFHVVRRSGSTALEGDVEDSVDMSLGYALAVNDTLAISMAVGGLFRGTAIAFEEARLREPGSFNVRFGVTSWLARGLYIEPSVSFSLNGPSRSFAFGVTLPYAF